LVNDQQSLQSIRETSWKDFEYLVAEAFRRQGYSVDYSLVQGADGGVDLTLRKGGRVSLVQCKQWKVYSVGAPVIREMFGIMTAEHADEAIIVTTGNFTREAQSFAMGKAIQLIDGAKLLELVRSVQTASEIKEQIQAAGQPISDRKAVTITSPGPENSSVTTVPACPQCGSQMKLRTARRGAKSGSQFWGCSTYPKCQGKRELHG
jgi:restriction system protein